MLFVGENLQGLCAFRKTIFFLYYILYIMTKDEALKILQLDETATWTQIKTKYRKLALQYHPDKVTGKEAEFVELANAYNFLESFYKDKAPQTKVPKTQDKDKAQQTKEPTTQLEIDTEQDKEIGEYIKLAKEIKKADEDYSNALKTAQALIPTNIAETVDIILPQFPNGPKYAGDVLIGKTVSAYPMAFEVLECPHGYGTKTHGNGDKYEGTFNDGKESGLGQLTTTNEIYKGFFKDGQIGMCVVIDKSEKTKTYYDNYTYCNNRLYKNRYCTKSNNLVMSNTTTIELLKKIKDNIEEDVKIHVEKAKKQSESAYKNQTQKENDAKTAFNTAVKNAKKTISHDVGYIIEDQGNTTYYGNIIEINGKNVAHGLGVKQSKKENYEYVGTFFKGAFTGLGYKKEGTYEYLGFFEKGKLNGMGMGWDKTYSDSFKDDKHSRTILSGYEFRDNNSCGYPKMSVNKIRGTNYLLVLEVQKNIENIVKDHMTEARTVADKAKKKENTDEEENKNKTKDEILNTLKEESLKKEQKKQENDKNEKQTKINDASKTYQSAINSATEVNEIKHRATINYVNGRYQGAVDNANNPHFVGTLTNDNVYQGNFKHGTMEGLGQLTYKDGSVYKGFFKDGKPNGWGVLISSDGKSKSYSDSFDGKNPGASFNEIPSSPKGNEETSLVEQTYAANPLAPQTNVAKPLKKDEKLFGENIYLVLEIRANIENDVKIVVDRAKEETNKAEIKRVEDEKAAKEKLETDRLANKGNNGSGTSTDNSKGHGTSTDNSKGHGTSTGNSTGTGTGTDFSKVALISAATAAATAGLYYAYKKYNKSAKKSSDKSSEKSSEPRRSSKKRNAKRSEPKRSAKRSEKKRSAKRSEPKRSEKKR